MTASPPNMARVFVCVCMCGCVCYSYIIYLYKQRCYEGIIHCVMGVSSEYCFYHQQILNTSTFSNICFKQWWATKIANKLLLISLKRIFLQQCILWWLLLLYFRDILLLETGFLAILVAPLNLFGWRSVWYHQHDHITFWLVKWLLFRLMFASGIVKLTSNCPTWWGLTGRWQHSMWQ